MTSWGNWGIVRFLIAAICLLIVSTAWSAFSLFSFASWATDVALASSFEVSFTLASSWFFLVVKAEISEAFLASFSLAVLSSSSALILLFCLFAKSFALLSRFAIVWASCDSEASRLICADILFSWAFFRFSCACFCFSSADDKFFAVSWLFFIWSVSTDFAFFSAVAFLSSASLARSSSCFAVFSVAILASKFFLAASRSATISSTPVPSKTFWAVSFSFWAFTNALAASSATFLASANCLEENWLALSCVFSSAEALLSSSALFLSSLIAFSKAFFAADSADSFSATSLFALSLSAMISDAPVPSRFFCAVATAPSAVETFFSCSEILSWSFLITSDCWLRSFSASRTLSDASFSDVSLFSISAFTSDISFLVFSIFSGVADSLFASAFFKSTFASETFDAVVASESLAFSNALSWFETDWSASSLIALASSTTSEVGVFVTVATPLLINTPSTCFIFVDEGAFDSTLNADSFGWVAVTSSAFTTEIPVKAVAIDTADTVALIVFFFIIPTFMIEYWANYHYIIINNRIILYFSNFVKL